MSNLEGKELSFEAKSAIVAILLVIIIIAGVAASTKIWEQCEEDRIRNKVHSYNIITINGIDYETDKIKEIDLTHSYAVDTVTFILSDGTEIFVSVDNWTLKD